MHSFLFASAALGTEDLVARELEALGFDHVSWSAGGVRFRVDSGRELEGAMRASLWLRTALRVLWPLTEYPCDGADALYEGAASVAWEEWVPPRATFAVGATTRAAPPLAHAPFLAQRIKDAIVDRVRERSGARPDVDRDDPDVRIYVHVAPGKKGTPVATVGIDASGASLHLRGYRARSTAAPLRETLAAAMVLASGWADGRTDRGGPRRALPGGGAAKAWSRPLLIDPMCGSGTIAIEAAAIAARIAPGRLARAPRAFGFERWPRFGDAEAAAWRRLRDEADAGALARAPAPIVASDRDDEALAIARACVAACVPAIAASIEVRRADARELAPLDPPGVVISNPPYGERLGGGVEAFYRALGARLRTLDGHTAFLLVPPDAPRALAMRPTWQRRWKNGPITVSFCRFELGRRQGRSSQQRKPVE